MRTALQAYQHILAEYLAGRLGALDSGSTCAYEDNQGKHCVVGCLFSPEQLADIKKLRINGMSINRVAEKIGKDNIEHVTGLSLIKLKELQQMHDDLVSYNFDAFRDGKKNTSFYKHVTGQIKRLTKAPK